jgi:hypothetical protein
MISHKHANEQQGIMHTEDKWTKRHEYLKIKAILLTNNLTPENGRWRPKHVVF